MKIEAIFWNSDEMERLNPCLVRFKSPKSKTFYPSNQCGAGVHKLYATVEVKGVWPPVRRDGERRSNENERDCCKIHCFGLGIGFCRFVVIKRLFLFFSPLILPFIRHFGRTQSYETAFCNSLIHRLKFRLIDCQMTFDFILIIILQ